MLKPNRVQLALALTTALAVGCGGNTAEGTGGTGGEGGTKTTSTTDTGGGGSGGGGSGGGGSGGGLTCESGEGPVLAVSSLHFGEGNSGEWKTVGKNLDGLESTATSKDVCKPNSGADPSTPYPDGDNGIDNSFGKNLLPLILSLYPTWVTDINNGILSGFFTSLVKMECLPPEGDAAQFTTKLFGATNLGNKPVWDGSDKWPVAPDLLSDPTDPLSSTVTFPKSSVINDEFDSGKNVTFILTVPLNTDQDMTSIKLTLYAAQTTMTLAADRKSATKGIIAGVVNTEELVAEVKKIGALLNLCDSQLLDNLIEQVRQSSDILVDGTQDPDKTCDGISAGILFDMKEAQIGEVGPPIPVGASCL